MGIRSATEYECDACKLVAAGDTRRLLEGWRRVTVEERYRRQVVLVCPAHGSLALPRPLRAVNPEVEDEGRSPELVEIPAPPAPVEAPPLPTPPRRPK